VAASILLVLMSLFAFVGPLASPYGPDAVSLTDRLMAPNLISVASVGSQPRLYNWAAIQAASAERPLTVTHPMGTDDLGRDTMTRLMYGGRVSLGIGVLVALLTVAIGATLGAISGYLGGWWDNAIMRLSDVEHSLPDIALLLVLAAMLPRGFWTMCLVLTLTGAFRSTRTTRAMTLALKQELYVEAVRSIGANGPRVISRHIIPNALSPLFVSITLGAGAAIRAESALSYLGLGIQPPMPSWGNILSNAQQYVFTAPWLVFFPGACIFLVLISFNLIGDGLRDAFDVRSVRR
jgi:peptide/nickel transport system permease protein